MTDHVDFVSFSCQSFAQNIEHSRVTFTIEWEKAENSVGIVRAHKNGH